MTKNERKQSRLQDMVIRGKEYREDHEFELYGEKVTGVLRPLPDKEFLPIVAFLAEHMGIDAEDVESETVEEAQKEIEEARGEDGDIDVSKLDSEFVASMQEAAALGLEGAYDEDGDYVDHTEEEVEEIVNGLLGGYSIELGGAVLDLSGNVREADKFREKWGRERGGSVRE